MKKGFELSVLSLGNFSCDLVRSTQEARVLSWAYLSTVKCKIPIAFGGFTPQTPTGLCLALLRAYIVFQTPTV